MSFDVKLGDGVRLVYEEAVYWDIYGEGKVISLSRHSVYGTYGVQFREGQFLSLFAVQFESAPNGLDTMLEIAFGS